MTTVTVGMKRMGYEQAEIDYAALPSGAVALLPKHTRNFGVVSGGLAVPIDQGKLRQLISIAVRYRARLSALKLRDLNERDQSWYVITQSAEGTFESGQRRESYWRNKSLFVRRVSVKEEFGTRYLPVSTEIACMLGTDAKALLTIKEGEYKARFDVISENGQSGYCLEGLDYDLALSEVFSLLSEVENLSA